MGPCLGSEGEFQFWYFLSKPNKGHELENVCEAQAPSGGLFFLMGFYVFGILS